MLVAALLLLLWAPSAFGAVAHDSTSTDAQGNQQNPSYTHTPSGSACANSVAIIAVGWQDDTGTLSSVTYGGNAATSLGARVQPQSDNSIQTFIYKNSGTGAATVQANFSETVNSSTITTRTYCGVDQTTSTGTRATGTNSVAAVSISVSSATGDLVIDDVYSDSNATSTVHGSQTQRANYLQSTNHRQTASEEAGGASSTTMSWTLSADHFWGSIGIALKPAATVTRRPIAPMVLP